ncbi:hypothetical protein EV401DRAFT_681080 [Pisolithus croceorrhizus]|nr:hypothetical protein EV401DRAFT_681080 [Pisolithus croceorrhizus]
MRESTTAGHSILRPNDSASSHVSLVLISVHLVVSMTGPDIGSAARTKLAVMHGATVTEASSNYRDASNGTLWREKPTPIPIPGRHFSGNNSARDGSSGNKNPFQFTNNLNKPRGNPVRSRTVLATARNLSPTDRRPSKRPKLDSLNGSPTTSPYFCGATTNGQGPSSACTSFHAHDPEPEVQEVRDPFAGRGKRTGMDDGEIIIVDGRSDDVGWPVARAGAASVHDRSSPDPILMTSTPKPRKHAFETHPGQLGAAFLDKGKRRESDFRKPVPPSEEESEDGIESWTSDYPRTSGMRSPAIPNGIVQQRRRALEGSGASKSARPYGDVPALNLLALPNSGPRIAQQMRRKDEGVDRVGTSSSGLIDSRKKRDSKISLPLEVWYLGHREFVREGEVPDKLTYNDHTKMMSLSFGRPVRKVEVQLDRAVDMIKVTNDNKNPLKGNPVIELTTIKGGQWKRWQDEFSDQFEGGGLRRRGLVTLVFSTNLPDWNDTVYQQFVNYLKGVCHNHEVVRPSGGNSIWCEAKKFAEMSAQNSKSRSHETSRVSSIAERSSTPSSSSARTRISAHSLKPPESKAIQRELRRSTRQFIAQSAKLTPPLAPQPNVEQDELVLMYPPGGPGALNIMRSDLKRLEPEEYLNDTLIEFGLKLWLSELREKDPLLADQIHVFSSFFYKKLNTKNVEEGFQSVRKWTAKVDLFSKKYIIVPINENLHWYLAIIYEPGHVLEPPLGAPLSAQARLTRNRKKERIKIDAKTERPESRSEAQGSSTSSVQEDENGLLSKVATRPPTPNVTQNVDMEDIDMVDASANAAHSDFKPAKPPSGSSGHAPSELMYPSSPIRGDAMDVDVVESSAGRPALPSPSPSDRLPEPQSGIPASSFYGPFTSKKGGKKLVAADKSVVILDSEDENDKRQEAEVDNMLREEPSESSRRPSQTYIFTLDSLGSRHTQVVKVLKTYLGREAKDKKGFDEVREAVGKQVQVPVQPNTWDCGVYLLHLTKVFMSNPEHYFRVITTTKGTMPSSDRRVTWQDQEVPNLRDHLVARITQLSEAWKAEKVAKEEEAKRRKREELEAEVLSSDGEVDIVQVSGEVKRSPQRRHANRLRG